MRKWDVRSEKVIKFIFITNTSGEKLGKNRRFFAGCRWHCWMFTCHF